MPTTDCPALRREMGLAMRAAPAYRHAPPDTMRCDALCCMHGGLVRAGTIPPRRGPSRTLQNHRCLCAAAHETAAKRTQKINTPNKPKKNFAMPGRDRFLIAAAMYDFSDYERHARHDESKEKFFPPETLQPKEGCISPFSVFSRTVPAWLAC